MAAPLTAIPTAAPTACRAALLKLEEDWISNVCTQIAKFKPDVVVTEEGPLGPGHPLSDEGRHLRHPPPAENRCGMHKVSSDDRFSDDPALLMRDGVLALRTCFM